jgi:hypothetical protein
MRVLAVVAMAFLVFACGDDGGGAPFPVPAECNPLGGGHCMEPWPSSVYELADATSATGVRLAIPVGGLVANANGDEIDPAPWNRADGFSAAAAIVTVFAGGVDGSTLVGHGDFAASLTDGSPTALIDLTTGTRVAHFAELDVPSAATPDSQALYLRPAARLTAGHRYGVGDPQEPEEPRAAVRCRCSPGFTGAARRRRRRPSAVPARAADRFGALRDALATAGVPADDLVLAWDFTVASDEFVHRLPRSARDQVVEPASPPPARPTASTTTDRSTPTSAAASTASSPRRCSSPTTAPTTPAPRWRSAATACPPTRACTRSRSPRSSRPARTPPRRRSG